jgi:hypothetical protein
MITAEAIAQFTFKGALTAADSKTYHPHTFVVPAGTGNIHIELAFAPFYATGRIHRNQIDLSVDDPDGIRGVWCLVKPEGMDINAVGATPGFVTAPLQPGEWTVYVAAHRILPPDTVYYTLTVTLADAPQTTARPAYDGTPRVANAAPGWYRGDLHAHTIHSDGSWDIPEFTAYMRGRGLDFVTLSDHNTVTGLAQHRSQTEPGFLAMGGMELSTFNGHMLALGDSHLYEWRLGIRPGVDIHHIMGGVIDRGALLIIAHPMSPDEPFCSGCHWTFAEARPGVALGVEVWNGYWHVFNEEALQQYYVWLNLGHRLVATSGSDIHGPPREVGARRAGANVVYAEALSEAAILTAVRQGHSYLSAGPELLLNATTAGAAAMAGDQLPAGDATVTVKWSGAHAGDLLRLIVDGQARETLPVAEAGEQSWAFGADEARWCTVELRDSAGEMWAVSNPMFFARFGTDRLATGQ